MSKSRDEKRRAFHKEIKKATGFLKQYIMFFVAIYVGWVLITMFTNIEKDLVYQLIEVGLAAGVMGSCGYLAFIILRAKRALAKEDEKK